MTPRQQLIKTLNHETPDHICVDFGAGGLTGIASGVCECAVYNPKLPLKFKLRFKKEQLPWLTNWQHLVNNEYVTTQEPGTNPPIGQSVARQNHALKFLQPGETQVY